MFYNFGFFFFSFSPPFLLFRVLFSELIDQVQFFSFGTEGRAIVCLLCSDFYAREEDCLRVTEKSVWVRKLNAVNLKYESVEHPQHVFCRCGMVAGLNEGNLVKIQNFKIVPLLSDYLRPHGLMPKIFHHMAAVFTCFRRSCKRVFAFDTADAISNRATVTVDSLFAFNVRRREDGYGTFDVYCVCGDKVGVEASDGKVQLYRFIKSYRVNKQVEVPCDYHPGQLMGEIEIDSDDSEIRDEDWVEVEDSDSGLE